MAFTERLGFTEPLHGGQLPQCGKPFGKQASEKNRALLTGSQPAIGPYGPLSVSAVTCSVDYTKFIDIGEHTGFQRDARIDRQ
jgi:hypothetical protein